MAVKEKQKNRAAVALGRKGGEKGGPARAAKLTAEERSESARHAVLARWAKHKEAVTGAVRKQQTAKPTPVHPVLDQSKKALHLCLKRIKDAKNDKDLHRWTEELQKIVFRKQYQNASN